MLALLPRANSLNWVLMRSMLVVDASVEVPVEPMLQLIPLHLQIQGLMQALTL